MSHEEFARQSARMFLENMVAESFLARDVGMVVTPAQVVDSTLAKVMKIAERDLPLARLMDSSDMLIHAEGPGAIHGMPWLKAVTWLLEMANDNIRRLAVAAIDLWGGDGKAVARHLDLRIPGMVPGSVWVGIKLMPPAADLLPVDAELVERLGANLAVLPELTRFIGDEGMCSGYEEVVPDPAIRDAHLGALYRMTPTGQRGIHTVELSAKGNGKASLSQRERVVLREVIARPDKRLSKEGVFAGEVREADLDKTRVHLRNVDGVGTLRCVMPELPAAKAAALLGKAARVQGRYLSDATGRPRLMFVESIEPTHVQQVLPG